MANDADNRHVAPERLDAIDALNKVERTALEEHPSERRDLDACWARIVARLRGPVSPQ
jgi:hypothetical protein